jgi:hypothetical protein
MTIGLCPFSSLAYFRPTRMLAPLRPLHLEVLFVSNEPPAPYEKVPSILLMCLSFFSQVDANHGPWYTRGTTKQSALPKRIDTLLPYNTWVVESGKQSLAIAYDRG